MASYTLWPSWEHTWGPIFIWGQLGGPLSAGHTFIKPPFMRTWAQWGPPKRTSKLYMMRTCMRTWQPLWGPVRGPVWWLVREPVRGHVWGQLEGGLSAGHTFIKPPGTNSHWVPAAESFPLHCVHIVCIMCTRTALYCALQHSTSCYDAHFCIE